jgi:hypothetical protein
MRTHQLLYLTSDPDAVAYKAEVDEYIVKPISLLLFHAKLKAWQRWIEPANKSTVRNDLQCSD